MVRLELSRYLQSGLGIERPPSPFLRCLPHFAIPAKPPPLRHSRETFALRHSRETSELRHSRETSELRHSREGGNLVGTFFWLVFLAFAAKNQTIKSANSFTH